MKKIFVMLMLAIISTHLYSYDIVDEFTRPFTQSTPRNILISGSLITASMVFIDRDFDKHNQQQISKHKKYNNMCKQGNEHLQIIPNIAYTLINGIIGYYFKDNDQEEYKRRAWDMFNATLYSGLLTDIIKPLANETRPSGGRYSFPSGHSTTAFAFASYVATEHAWYYGIASYLMATCVAYSRIASNFHYPHDTVMGAAIGISYGLSQFYKNNPDKLSYVPMIIPSSDGAGMQMLFTRDF